MQAPTPSKEPPISPRYSLRFLHSPFKTEVPGKAPSSMISSAVSPATASSAELVSSSACPALRSLFQTLNCHATQHENNAYPTPLVDLIHDSPLLGCLLGADSTTLHSLCNPSSCTTETALEIAVLSPSSVLRAEISLNLVPGIPIRTSCHTSLHGVHEGKSERRKTGQNSIGHLVQLRGNVRLRPNHDRFPKRGLRHSVLEVPASHLLPISTVDQHKTTLATVLSASSSDCTPGPICPFPGLSCSLHNIFQRTEIETTLQLTSPSLGVIVLLTSASARWERRHQLRVERYLDTVEVGGSKPPVPTNYKSDNGVGGQDAKDEDKRLQRSASTGNRKIKRRKAYRSHILTKMTTKRKRNLRGGTWSLSKTSKK